jgi:hypothetical protein
MGAGGLCGLGGSAVGDSARSAEGKAPSAIENFPLWMNVPAKSFAVLDEGLVRQTRWALYVYRGSGSQGRRKPCLDLATLYFGVGEGESFRNGTACGSLAPPAKNVVTAKADFQIQKSVNGPIVGSTVLGMTVGIHVEKIEVDMGSDGTVVGKTRYLSARQAAKAHVQRFRYFTLDRAKKVCLDAIRGFSFSGEEVVDDGLDECP